MSENEHKWLLRGGSFTKNSSNIGQGVALFQCAKCGLTASRALTARNEQLNAVVPKPEIEEECIR